MRTFEFDTVSKAKAKPLKMAGVLKPIDEAQIMLVRHSVIAQAEHADTLHRLTVACAAKEMTHNEYRLQLNREIQAGRLLWSGDFPTPVILTERETGNSLLEFRLIEDARLASPDTLLYAFLSRFEVHRVRRRRC
jgi:hypothetical protein